MFLNSVNNRIRNRIWGKADEDDGDINEAQDTLAISSNDNDDEVVKHTKISSAFKFIKTRIHDRIRIDNDDINEAQDARAVRSDENDSEVVDQAKKSSVIKSIKNRIPGRLWGKGQNKGEEFTESKDTRAARLENDDSDFAKPSKDGSSQKSSEGQKLKRLWGKKPAKGDNAPGPKDLLTVQEDNDEVQVAEQPQDDVDSILQPAGEITEPASKDSGESKEGCADEKDETDLLAGIFDQAKDDQEEPLEILIASLSDVGINELVDETKEVQALIIQWHQNVMSK